ncbi:hypothetical protein [Nocardioides currus]|uniref:Uncharacterized protein n=1 Tax=Nocardioides currus TaxID=2133958 RepID=A0A2R7Z285_9ACTN|nr:hypothetical protein [Nocardioides currus]PUA82720.1 hypothetical protein C7S10_03085 [Nocardioides currus]
MTDTQIRDRLRGAVDDTTAPPAFAHVVLTRGRARRRRRYAAGALVAAAAIVAAATVVPAGGPLARDGEPASTYDDASARLAWARSLPAGPVPGLPFFGDDGLHAGEALVPLPASVNRTVPPRTVRDGWLVVVGQREDELAWAVLAADGALEPLPEETWAGGLGDVRAVVAPDGGRVALGRWMVDLATMAATPVPHVPGSDVQKGYYTQVRMVGFTAEGLVYEAAPFHQGIGTTWLLRDDGSTVRVEPPGGSHVRDGGPADLALRFDYADDDTDTCVTTFRLVGSVWTGQGSGCLGGYLGEALAVSDDARWLVTDDLPEVWDLREGRFARVDLPREVVEGWGDGWMGSLVWEDDDSVLLPVSDPDGEGATDAFDQSVQVVRCTLSTGACERAGDEQHVVVRTDGMSTTGVRFAQ